jgi:hypothetical protein
MSAAAPAHVLFSALPPGGVPCPPPCGCSVTYSGFLASGTLCADWYTSISVPDLVTITGMIRRWVYYRHHGLASADQAIQTMRGQWRITPQATTVSDRNKWDCGHVRKTTVRIALAWRESVRRTAHVGITRHVRCTARLQPADIDGYAPRRPTAQRDSRSPP